MIEPALIMIRHTILSVKAVMPAVTGACSSELKQSPKIVVSYKGKSARSAAIAGLTNGITINQKSHQQRLRLNSFN